jgi:hypothetical protein
MSFNKWFCLVATGAFALGSQTAVAQGHGNGHGHGQEKHAEEVRGHGHDRDDWDHHSYREHDRELHDWYRAHNDHLPPGLAKKDRLPPGLERQLVTRGTLPPGLRGYMRPCPVEVVHYLPPAPAGYMHIAIGGNIALVNKNTYFVLDVFHFE